MRAAIGELNDLAERFGNSAYFVFVYIAEAHACDEWPISQLEQEIPRHRTLADRHSAAASFLRAFPLHRAFQVALDTMDDAFDRVFASWPFRFWVVDDGIIALKPQPREAMYDLAELSDWLERHCCAAARK